MSIRFLCFIFAVSIFTCAVAAPCLGQSGTIIHARTTSAFELQGYAGLETISIYHGTLAAGESLKLETPYNGLAMLIFSGGQRYPVILGKKSSDLIITSPDEQPSFADGDENQLFYQLLSGEKPAGKGDGVARLLIQGKELLDSSNSIQTVEELREKKIDFQEFVQSNYLKLSHSDLIQRLVSQYFMMHEYVRYHQEGSPAGDIRLRYQQEVLAGVRSLLVLVQDDIPGNKLLNYIIGFYYNRGMVTFASFIADNFREIAHCEGENLELSDFPANLKLTLSDGSTVGELGKLKGAKTISLVSSDCPVSIVKTVMKARETVSTKNHTINRIIIVVPLEKLSVKHRGMSRNVSGGKMLFINDEKWREENLSKIIRLPFFVNIAQSKIQ